MRGLPGSWAILSAASALLGDDSNAHRHILMGEAIGSRGLFALETEGSWNGVYEAAYAIRLDEDGDFVAVLRLAHRYEQDSVLHICALRGTLFSPSGAALKNLDLEFSATKPDGGDYTFFPGLAGPVYMRGIDAALNQQPVGVPSHVPKFPLVAQGA